MPRKKTGFTQKKYYKQNREGLNWSKKQRYANDPEYREAILRRSKERYLAERKLDSCQRLGDNVYELNGVRYYTVKHIADKCGISTALVWYYHNNGYLPKPKPVGTYTWKMYRNEFVEAAVPVLLDFSHRRFTDINQMAQRFKDAVGDETIYTEIVE